MPENPSRSHNMIPNQEFTCPIGKALIQVSFRLPAFA